MSTERHKHAYMVYFSARPEYVLFVTSKEHAMTQASAIAIAAEEAGLQGLLVIRPVSLAVESDDAHVAREREAMRDIARECGIGAEN